MRSCFRSMLLGLAALLVAAPAAAVVVSYTNNILTVFTDNAGTSAGMFWVKTGSAHPNPNQNVIYDSQTSYITLRDVTAGEIWTDAGFAPSSNIPGFVSRSMQAAPATVAVTNLPTGFRMTYTLPNWVVVQDVVVNGTTLADTNVRQSVTVTNTSAVSRSYGVRYMWDWEIAGNDSSVFRTRNPDGTFTNVFIGFNSPGFQAFEEQDTLVNPTFSVFGTVGGGSLLPAPTQPERVAYVSWGDFESAPWDFPITGSNSDSATVHYWGYAAPLVLAPAASRTFIEYISTNPTSVGVGPGTTAATQVPTLSQWALFALVGLVVLLGMRFARPRGIVASSPARWRTNENGGPRAAVSFPAGCVSRAASASCRRQKPRTSRDLRCSAP